MRLENMPSIGTWVQDNMTNDFGGSLAIWTRYPE